MKPGSKPPEYADYDAEWAKQRARRSKAARGNKGHSNLIPCKPGANVPSGDRSVLTKWSDAQCIKARAMLIANKRSSRKGLSWIAIAACCDLPFNLIHKLQRDRLSNGKIYRRDAVPTEEMIQHYQDMLEAKYLEDRNSKAMIYQDRKAIEREVEAATSMAEAEAHTRQNDQVSWFQHLCRDNGLIIPRKPDELNWTLGQILELNIAGLDKEQLSKAFNQVMARLENMKVNSPDWNHTYPDSRKRIPKIN